MPTQLASVHLPDERATTQLGEWLGRRLAPGHVLALAGPVGAGKTTLVRGLARGLGLDEPDAVQSPTYLLVMEHPGPKRLLHADAYLPAKLAGMLADGGLEYLFDPTAVVVVEWAERIRSLLPEPVLWVELALAPTAGRTATLQSCSPAAFPFARELPMIG